MPVETGTTLSNLDDSWPLSGDNLHEGDDHLRLIKSILKSQFPGSDGDGLKSVIVATETELNYLDGVSSKIQDQLNTLSNTLNGLNVVYAALNGSSSNLFSVKTATSDDHALTKKQHDDSVTTLNSDISGKAPKEGDTNQIFKVGEPVAADDAVTKKYVDDSNAGADHVVLPQDANGHFPSTETVYTIPSGKKFSDFKELKFVFMSHIRDTSSSIVIELYIESEMRIQSDAFLLTLNTPMRKGISLGEEAAPYTLIQYVSDTQFKLRAISRPYSLGSAAGYGLYRILGVEK